MQLDGSLPWPPVDPFLIQMNPPSNTITQKLIFISSLHLRLGLLSDFKAFRSKPSKHL